MTATEDSGAGIAGASTFGLCTHVPHGVAKSFAGGSAGTVDIALLLGKEPSGRNSLKRLCRLSGLTPHSDSRRPLELVVKPCRARAGALPSKVALRQESPYGATDRFQVLAMVSL